MPCRTCHGLLGSHTEQCPARVTAVAERCASCGAEIVYDGIKPMPCDQCRQRVARVHESPDLPHVALHLAKYAGELAAIAEHLAHADDAEKRAKGLRLAARWARGRSRAVNWSAREADRLVAEVLA